MNKKLTLLLFVGLITILIIISWCLKERITAEEQEIQDTNSSLKFSAALCDPEIIADKEGIRGIINSTWINNNTIVITAYTHSTCGGCSLHGDYEIQRKNLILKTNEICGEIVTDCICPKIITYEISNLNKRDYSISFQ